MQEFDFSTRSYGKCILAGEHAVLRNFSAIALPVRSSYLHLQYKKQNMNLEVQFAGSLGSELNILFWSALEKALQMQSRSRADLSGYLRLENNIQIGAGLGASAAVCVAISRWFQYLGWIQDNELFEFSRQMENVFHGESSGIDIAVNLANSAIAFKRGGEKREVLMTWQPKLALSYCGVRGFTSECVNKVKTLALVNPELAKKLDLQMAEAVSYMEKSLSHANSNQDMIQAMNLAKDCFENWGLCSGNLGEHMKQLEQRGALAVKPTGSGNGGFVLSLWDKSIPSDLIPVF